MLDLGLASQFIVPEADATLTDFVCFKIFHQKEKPLKPQPVQFRRFFRPLFSPSARRTLSSFQLFSFRFLMFEIQTLCPVASVISSGFLKA